MKISFCVCKVTSDQINDAREICSKLERRGASGESIFHLCIQNSSSKYNYILAKRLLLHFPKMVNDIYISEEFYGESPLHIAIINENPHMAKMLLQHGADVHQRACGKFFCPEDQKAERIDNLLSEYASLPSETDYSGYFYYGEYPLSWAAVLNQVECVRLLVAYGANVNKQDSNGNTALHMLVISNNLVKIIYIFLPQIYINEPG